MISREQLRAAFRAVAATPPVGPWPSLTVEGRAGASAEVTISVKDEVLLIVTGSEHYPEGRARLSPEQARELAAALLAMAAHVEVPE